MASATNNETILEALKVIFSALSEVVKLIFNRKATTAANEEEKAKHTTITQQTGPSVGWIDPVEFSWHFGHLPLDEQMQIRDIIEQNIKDGIKDYSFKTKSSKLFYIRNGGQVIESSENYTK